MFSDIKNDKLNTLSTQNFQPGGGDKLLLVLVHMHSRLL
jgi:hypothetical protein